MGITKAYYFLNTYIKGPHDNKDDCRYRRNKSEDSVKKTDGQAACNEYKPFCEDAFRGADIPWEDESVLDECTSWQNSGNLSKYFWAHFSDMGKPDRICSVSFSMEIFPGDRITFYAKLEVSTSKLDDIEKKDPEEKSRILDRFNEVAKKDLGLDEKAKKVFGDDGLRYVLYLDMENPVDDGIMLKDRDTAFPRFDKAKTRERKGKRKAKYKRICPALLIADEDDIIHSDEPEKENEIKGRMKAAAEILTVYYEEYYKVLSDERSEGTGEKTQVDEEKNRMKKIPKNMILYGPPGTGKTYSTVLRALETIDGKPGEYEGISYSDYESEALPLYNIHLDNGRIRFVTFHQSYGYEEFIEGIRPSTDEHGNVSYEVKPGVFKKFCDDARKGMGEDKDGSKDIPYVFIIDEINRGNISKIFGELITLIEDDKREGASEATSALLPYPKKDENGKETEDCFSVPRNVYIIGTMNTADRSITSLDTALRRRFDFEDMMPRPELLDGIEVDGVNIRDMLDAMNRRIEVLYDREHQIGHAYFMKLGGGSRIGDLAVIFKNKIIPLLQEYFYDDYAKIRMVLADDQTDDGNEQFITETRVGDMKDNLFAPDADMGDRTVYGINGGALSNPASYRKIYGGIKKGDAPEEQEKKPEGGVGQP